MRRPRELGGTTLKPALAQPLTPGGSGDPRVLKDVGRALVLYRRAVMPYAAYSRKRKGSSDEAEVQQYGGLVGQDCIERILLYRT
ncbi:hypothetical protein NQZ68_019771 [Dissostichus eleginoides]|nr:hypothetical protein NQZ68_019771 [Dissostichus eleginoides]